MKNELKLNIIESIEEIRKVVIICKESMVEHTREINAEAARVETLKYKHKMMGDVIPIFNDFNDSLTDSLKATTSSEDKKEILNCIEHLEDLHKEIRDGQMGLIYTAIGNFKAYVDGLVENNEQIHRGSIGQGSSTKQGKEPSDQQDQDHKN